MAFRKKAPFVLKYKPDILIISECEHPKKLEADPDFPKSLRSIWYGQNENKGLGIFASDDFCIELMACHNPAFKTILPVAVRSAKVNFILFGIWANNTADTRYQYIGQVWKAIQEYETLLQTHSVLLVGDFNSNAIWDKPQRSYNHSGVVEMLHKLNIQSAYHNYFNQVQGKEKHPTLYMYRHKDKPYHIDYCFSSADFTQKIKKVSVGKHAHWSVLSDHSPLVIDFDI